MRHFLTLLSLQGTAGFISLIGTLVVVFTVVFLIITSGKNEDKELSKAKVYKLRRKYFWSLILVLITGFGFSMTMLPYPQFKKDIVNSTFTVVAYQWRWAIAPGEFEGDISEFKGSKSIDIEAGQNIKFNVIAKDVNHSFGIYDMNNSLVAQTQAMPGYINQLHYKFEQKGEYKVICMEYCGVAHHAMIATINVN